MSTRIETDSLGEVAVPADRYWGAQTQRSLGNFPIGRERMPLAVIHALARIKHAAAEVNEQLGVLDARRGDAIRRAAREVFEGDLDEHFPLVVWQTGSGTQSNMNVNEVIANRANELLGAPLGAGRPVHPNDHVNRSQSSNDVFPSAMSIAALTAVEDRLRPALDGLAAALERHARDWASIVKIGRTHLMDATPVTFGQVFSGYAAQVRGALEALDGCLPRVRELAVGGTAVGTGLNAPPGFGEAMAKALSQLAGRELVRARNAFSALAASDALVELSAALRLAACALTKIANDVRWLGSGPRCGIGELRLPANEPGSSIMPGKVNPTQCEALTMVCARVLGNDTTIAVAGASGNFELNVYRPVIAHAVLESVGLLADAVASFEQRCIAGLEVDEARTAELLERSLMLVTALTPRIGYDAAASIAKRAHAEGRTLRDVVIEEGLLDSEEFDRLVDPKAMTRPA